MARAHHHVAGADAHTAQDETMIVRDKVRLASKDWRLGSQEGIKGEGRESDRARDRDI